MRTRTEQLWGSYRITNLRVTYSKILISWVSFDPSGGALYQNDIRVSSETPHLLFQPTRLASALSSKQYCQLSLAPASSPSYLLYRTILDHVH